MEIIITNKQIKELAKINNAQNVESFGYNGSCKFKFITINNHDLVKYILYVDHNDHYHLEKRR